MSTDKYQFERHDVPIAEPLINDLIDFWQRIFGLGFSWCRPVLSGSERDANRDILFLARIHGQVVASCRLTINQGDPRIAALGEVATSTAHRGQGLGTAVCGQATDEFDGAGGQAMFLGTGNPNAARIYERLGWRFLPGSHVMARTSAGQGPQKFFAEYFGNELELPVRVEVGGPHHRIPMIPLILTPHPWLVLDANTDIRSCRYFAQGSCEGLYQRYDELGDRAAWWAAVLQDGRVVGLSSAKLLDDGSCCVEAFAHPIAPESCVHALYRDAIEWAGRKGAEPLTTCAVGDHDKADCLRKLPAEPVQKTLSCGHAQAPLTLELWRFGAPG